MKKITVEFNGMDKNGNKKYLVNYVDTEAKIEQKEINRNFSPMIGRLTNKGISTQSSIEMLEGWANDYLSMALNCRKGVELAKAQKDIDRLRAYHSQSYIDSSYEVLHHSKVLHERSYFLEWADCDIEEVQR